MLIFLAMSSCLQNEPRRRPVRYLIPDGYVGWVKINFRVQSAPALPIEDGYYLARMPEAGELGTSSDIEYGWAKDEYYYYVDDTRHPLKATTWGGGGFIWGGFNGQEQDPNQKVVQTYLQFFVGTEDQYKSHIGPPGVKKAGRVSEITSPQL
jgi:hypothetical protein